MFSIRRCQDSRDGSGFVSTQKLSALKSRKAWNTAFYIVMIVAFGAKFRARWRLYSAPTLSLWICESFSKLFFVTWLFGFRDIRLLLP